MDNRDIAKGAIGCDELAGKRATGGTLFRREVRAVANKVIATAIEVFARAFPVAYLNVCFLQLCRGVLRAKAALGFEKNARFFDKLGVGYALIVVATAVSALRLLGEPFSYRAAGGLGEGFFVCGEGGEDLSSLA